MKLKSLFFFVLLTTITGAAIAQSVQVKAGVNLANISVTNSGSIDKAKELTSFQVGIVGDLPLGTKILSFQPGLLFTGKGAKTQFGDPASNQYYIATSNPFYLEVPANLVINLPMGSKGGFFVGAGPYIAMGIAGKNKVEGKSLGVAFSSEKNIRFSNDDPTTTNYEEGAGFGIMRRFDYGVNGIVGVESKPLVLSVGYGYGLAKLQSGSNSSANDANKHRVLSLTLGVKL